MGELRKNSHICMNRRHNQTGYFLVSLKINFYLILKPSILRYFYLYASLIIPMTKCMYGRLEIQSPFTYKTQFEGNVVYK